MDFEKVLNEETERQETEPKSTLKVVGTTIPEGAVVIWSMDHMKAQAKAAETLDALEKSMAAVYAMEVVDDKTAAQITDLASSAKKAGRAIDMAMKAFVSPANERIKEIRGFAKIFTEKAAAIEAEAKTKIKAWHQSERIKREKEDAEKRRLAEIANKKLAEEAKAIGMSEEDTPKVEVPTAPKLPPVIRTQNGAKSSVSMVWKFKVEDLCLIPGEYMIPDNVKIGKAVRAGVRDIPGINIFQDEQISI